jgi:hypothetical protein
VSKPLSGFLFWAWLEAKNLMHKNAGCLGGVVGFCAAVHGKAQMVVFVRFFSCVKNVQVLAGQWLRGLRAVTQNSSTQLSTDYVGKLFALSQQQ